MTYATVQSQGDLFAVVEAGKDRPLARGKTPQEAREDYEGSLPLVYGYRPIRTDNTGRTTNAIGWARLGIKLFRLTYRYFYAKEGEGSTVQVSVSRKHFDGTIWTGKTIKNPKDHSEVEAFVADLVKINDRQTKATVPFRKRTSKVTVETKDARPLVTEDWTA